MRFSSIPLSVTVLLLCVASVQAQTATKPKNPIRIVGGVSLGIPETSPSREYTGTDDPENDTEIDGIPFRVSVEYDFYRTPGRTYQVFYGYVEQFRASLKTQLRTPGGGLSPEQSPDGTLSYTAIGLGMRMYPFGVKRSGSSLFFGLGAGLYRANSKVYGVVGDEDAQQYGVVRDKTTRPGGRIHFGWEGKRIIFEISGTYAGSTEKGLPLRLSNTAVSLGLRL